jgi:hypothetical protein
MDSMSAGIGLLLLLAGSSLLAHDSAARGARRSLGLAILFLLMTSGLLLDSAERDYP